MNHDRTVHEIPLTEIFCDNDFNCRGKIAPLDVVDLARDIKQRGLDIPIIVQPYTEHPPHKYRIVAGHRRYMAFRVNESPTIPTNIRTDLDEFAAAGLNLRENILRKQLNIKQEANGIRKFMLAAWSEQAVAEYIYQSRGWVQVRFMLLRLPEDIQNECAAGLIGQEQIRKLVTMKNGSDEQYAYVRAIKEAKIRGEKVEMPATKPRNHLIADNKVQNKFVIFAMIDHLLQNIGSSLVTRALAWACGEINDYQLHEDIAKHCKENNKFYEIPEAVKNAFKNTIMDVKK